LNNKHLSVEPTFVPTITPFDLENRPADVMDKLTEAEKLGLDHISVYFQKVKESKAAHYGSYTKLRTFFSDEIGFDFSDGKHQVYVDYLKTQLAKWKGFFDG
jgi:hypothetical protein